MIFYSPASLRCVKIVRYYFGGDGAVATRRCAFYRSRSTDNAKLRHRSDIRLGVVVRGEECVAHEYSFSYK